jgi:Fic family protein
MNPFARALAFHFIAVAIHPFVDGNGRTVRLMQHLFLLKDGQDIARFVPSETAVMRQRSQYYFALQQTRELHSLHPILEFLAECFAISAEEVILEGKNLLKKSSSRKPEVRHQKILKFAKGKTEFSMQDVVGLLPDIPRRTLERDLSLLTKKEVLKATGDNKARVYSLKK